MDACTGGCGGVWFDAFELEKMDEPHEGVEAGLLELEPRPGAVPDPEKPRDCPRCEIPLMRHSFSVRHRVQVDECGKCGGIWLDAGELARIRSLFPTEAERKETARRTFEERFGPELAAMRAESLEGLAKARKFARLLRFLCPSWYIPGKQDWGAY